MNDRSIEARVSGYEEDQEYDSTPLMWAVREKDTKAIKFLLNRMSKTDVQTELDKQDSWGRTALHLACSYRPDLEMIKLLLDAGASPDVRNNEDETPLFKAIQTANLDVVHLLLQRGANVEAEHGKHALEEAESLGLVAIVESLKQVEAGH